MPLTKTISATIDIASQNYVGLDDTLILQNKEVYTLNLTIHDGGNPLDITGYDVSLLLGGTEVALTHVSSSDGTTTLSILDTALIFPTTGLQKLILKIVDGTVESHFRGITLYTNKY